MIRSSATGGTDGGGFEFAKFWLAVLLENIANGLPGRRNDALIGIDERPAELLCEQARRSWFFRCRDNREARRP